MVLEASDPLRFSIPLHHAQNNNLWQTYRNRDLKSFYKLASYSYCVVLQLFLVPESRLALDHSNFFFQHVRERMNTLYLTNTNPFAKNVCKAKSYTFAKLLNFTCFGCYNLVHCVAVFDVHFTKVCFSSSLWNSTIEESVEQVIS